MSLNESDLTALLGEVNTGIVTPLQTNLNGLLGPLSTLLLPGLPSPLNINVGDIVGNAVAGNPISVDVLNSNNTIVGPGECNVTVDGLTLNNPAGIGIGGNQITGLGQGEVASAGTEDSIAFGNGATTGLTATGAIALGTDAEVTAVNGMALGTGSTASAINSVALGTGSLADRINSVSVGALGAERQITNVLDGTADTDAATVGQVNASIAAAVGDTVTYDSAAHTAITLDGVGGTTITGLAAGTLDATSTDAVNGSQLFATNQNVTANADDIDAIDTRVTANEGDIAALQDTSVMYTDATQTEIALGGTGGTTISNVAGGELSGTSTEAVNGSQLFATNQNVAVNAADIDTIDTRVTTNETDIAALQDTSVAYDDATQTSITLGGAGGTTIANVADGELSATSTEAVNGSQLFATNQAVDALDGRVTQNETDIAQNRTDINNLQTSVGQIQVTVDGFDDRITQNETDIVNLDNRVTVNEGDIANLDTRVTVNEGDIANLDGRVTVNEGDIANLDGRVTVNEGDIANLDGRVTVNEGDIANLDTRVTVNEGDIDNLDDRVTVNEGDIVTLDTRVTVNETDIDQIQADLANVPVGYVAAADTSTRSSTPTNTVAFFGADDGPVQVTNVAAGTLSATSTDAVNGSQLFTTNQNVQQNTDDIQTINNNLAGSTIVAVQYSNPDNPTASNGGTITNDVTLIGRDASAPVALHNVADATAATDAVNLRQMEAGLTGVLTDSMNYTDMRVAQIGFDLAELRDDAFSGTASAMAMASIPQALEPGRMMVGGGVGYYRGEASFGFGLSSAFADGKAVLKVSGTMGANGKGGVAAGAGFSF
ncbi:YadA-like family protein [Qipengyuania citrea]|uniref:YadA-like family protein n=1 Tax=Qipengyuania citrea TaxID=225971 RepID=A0ABY4UBI8_9SPHN|nr:YadA-like family protein [Qipengyuania citrea]USA62201.1 YadA-like family protein [Qipengyuania citrea]